MTIEELRKKAISKELCEFLGLSVDEVDALQQQIVDFYKIRFTVPGGQEKALELVEAGKIHTLGGGRYLSGLGLRQLQKLVDPDARIFQEVC